MAENNAPIIAPHTLSEIRHGTSSTSFVSITFLFITFQFKSWQPTWWDFCRRFCRFRRFVARRSCLTAFSFDFSRLMDGYIYLHRLSLGFPFRSTALLHFWHWVEMERSHS